MTVDDMEKLISELHDASQMYYQGESSPLTDEEFDAKVSLLTEVKDEFPDLFAEGSDGWKLLDNEVGSTATISSSISHNVPMLSLNKAKNVSELETFVARVKKEGRASFSLQSKLDGFALSVVYEGGALRTISTRGNGYVGEDVSYLLSDPNVTLMGLPETAKKDMEIRGELFFTDSQFEKVNKERKKLTGDVFKNSRNAVVGLMKKSEKGVDFPVEFTFSTYSVLVDDHFVNLSDFHEDGFVTVSDLTAEQVNGECVLENLGERELFDAIQIFGELRKGFSIPTDGVVVKPTDEAYLLERMGSTSHHPSSQIAWKYPGETADAVVESVEVNVGRTGKLNPVAAITPVFVSGTEIRNVTLNNFNWIVSKGIKVGSIVKVRRANDVIPEIVCVVSNPESAIDIAVPKVCPSCDGELVVDGDFYPPKTIRCTNVSCPSRNSFGLLSAVGKGALDIDGLSSATLSSLIESGLVNDVSDLYKLTLPVFSAVSHNGKTLGEKRARRILDSIEESKKLPLNRILLALNVDGLGGTTARTLVSKFSTMSTISQLSVSDIESLEGFGSLTAQKIVDGLSEKKSLIDALRECGLECLSEDNSEGKSDELSGLSFSISGPVPEGFANRRDFVDFIENHGGEFHSTPKKTTTYMIGDRNDTSSKIVKANTLGLEFLTPSKFVDSFLS